MMNTDNLPVPGADLLGSSDPYNHHHLSASTHSHHHLLPPHPSSIYCSSSTPYAELFSPYASEFVTSHDGVVHSNLPTDYLLLQNSLDYVTSHHQHHQLPTHLQQQQQQQPGTHPHHPMATSSNGERTSSSNGTSMNSSDLSPSHSYGTSSGYSSSVDYYNTPVLTSKTHSNSTNNNTNSSSTNNNNTNNTLTHNSSSVSPYDSTSIASTSSPPHSSNYLNAVVKQESIMPTAFTIDRHCNSYGTSNANLNGNPTSNGNFSVGIDEYNASLYHSSTANGYGSYSPGSLLQSSYPVGPYNVSHPDSMRFYNAPMKHDYGIDMRFKLVGNQRSSSNTDVSPSQLCAVCQDTAQCQHYGVRTCEGCKGFFKRTVQKNAKYVCLADKNCPVDKRRRNRCQYCRFQTCLAVGMDKEVVRTDALKGRRGRLPSKPKSPSTRQPNSFQTQFCRLYNDSIPNPASLDYSKLNYRTVTNKENLAEEKLLIYDGFIRSSDVIKQWVDKFSLFYSIPSDERDRLFSNCLLEQLVFRLASRVDGDRLILCSGIVIHKVQMNYLLNDVAQQIYDYASALKSHRIDPITTASLASLLFLDSNNSDYSYQRVSFSSTVTDLYQKIADSLKDYLKQHNEDSSMYLQLLERLNDARRIAHHFRKRLLLYRHTAGFSNALNTLLDFVLEGKPLSTDSQHNEETSTLPFVQYDL